MSRFATFNCNGNGRNPFKHIVNETDFRATHALQCLIEANIESSKKMMRDVVGPYLDALWCESARKPAEIQSIIESWLDMRVNEFYGDKHIALYRLTAILDLSVGDQLYPWGCVNPPCYEIIEEKIQPVIKPIPMKYNLPDIIQEHSVFLQRVATHLLVRLMWSHVPNGVLSDAHKEMEIYTTTFADRAVKCIIDICDEHDVVLFQGCTRAMIDAIDEYKGIDGGYTLLYNEDSDALFYSAIVYRERRGITLDYWSGSSRQIFCSMRIDGNMYVLGSIHALSMSSVGAIKDTLDIYKLATELDIERVVVGGDANTTTGENKFDKEGSLSQLGSIGFRAKLEEACMISHIIPMWHEPTQHSTKSYLQANGHKAGILSRKSCDFLSSNSNDAGYTVTSLDDADTLPSMSHCSDHFIVSAEFIWG